MSQRSSIYSTSTARLYEIVSAERFAYPGAEPTDPLLPKWQYVLRPVDIEYTSHVFSQATTHETIVGFNVWELNNTPTTWFGLANTEYSGLEFEPAPVGAVVMASAPSGTMVDSSGAPELTIPVWVVFQYPNQLAGECA